MFNYFSVCSQEGTIKFHCDLKQNQGKNTHDFFYDYAGQKKRVPERKDKSVNRNLTKQS